jgi:hypothetical protein
MGELCLNLGSSSGAKNTGSINTAAFRGAILFSGRRKALRQSGYSSNDSRVVPPGCFGWVVSSPVEIELNSAQEPGALLQFNEWGAAYIVN